jgi:23S rRNA pseudouridine1911/1915/1917 synthase
MDLETDENISGNCDIDRAVRHYRIKSAPNSERVRLDVFITGHVQYATRSKVQQLVESGGVTINGREERRPGRMVQPGDIVECDVPRVVPVDIAGEDIPLDILYEDEDIIIVNKPAGMVAHPACGNLTGTLVNALMYHTSSLSSGAKPGRPGILHRLDKDTTGILCVAKNDAAHAYLAKQFAEHTIEREYWAIVWGPFDRDHGTIDAPIGRHKSDRKKMAVASSGKHAITEYHVVRAYGPLTLVRFVLHTGRTHQIRVHCSHIHHPLLGDPTYGGRHIVYGSVSGRYKAFIQQLLEVLPRQALHARVLGIVHPASRTQMRFTSELPDDMKRALQMMEEYFSDAGQSGIHELVDKL